VPAFANTSTLAAIASVENLLKTLKHITTLLVFVSMYSCGLECVDKKTDMPKVSSTMKKAKELSLFHYELFSPRKEIVIDSQRSIKIRNIWVEDAWMYKCVDNYAVVQKGDHLQVVMDAEYLRPENDFSAFAVLEPGRRTGVILGGQLVFAHPGKDTVTLELMNPNKQLLCSLKFWRLHDKN
jgi:hypothetical protein